MIEGVIQGILQVQSLNFQYLLYTTSTLELWGECGKTVIKSFLKIFVEWIF